MVAEKYGDKIVGGGDLHWLGSMVHGLWSYVINL